MARSGSSLSRKFRPLKYEFGKLRVSDSICRISTRAAIHPRANTNGTKINHQGSKSTSDVPMQHYSGASGAIVSGATAPDVGLAGEFLICSRRRPRSRLSFFASRRRSMAAGAVARKARSEEHTSELQSLMRISYAVFCLKKKTK